MALNYFVIVANSLLAGILSVILTQFIFFVIARIFNYDFIFPIETGRVILGINQDFYSDFYAGIRGFLVHIGIGLIIMFIDSLIFVQIIGVLFGVGPYTYVAYKGTAIKENVIYLVILGLFIYLVFFLRDNNFDKFSIFLFLYIMTLVIIMGVIYGLYIFGNPGMLPTA